MDIQPLYNRIIVERNEYKSKAGIVLPDSAKSTELFEGKVIAKGDEVQVLNVGDQILWGQYAGGQIERNGKKYLVMNDDDVLGLIKEGS